MKTWLPLLGLVLLGCGSSEAPTSTSSGSSGDASSSGGPERGDAGECDYPLTGGLDLTISAPSDNCNAETRHLAVDPAPMVGTYGTEVCTKGCTVITGGCVLGQSKQKTLANIQVAFAGKPVGGKTYTIIPAKTGSDENGNPGLPADGGYVAFFEGPSGLMPSRSFTVETPSRIVIKCPSYLPSSPLSPSISSTRLAAVCAAIEPWVSCQWASPRAHLARPWMPSSRS